MRGRAAVQAPRFTSGGDRRKDLVAQPAGTFENVSHRVRRQPISSIPRFGLEEGRHSDQGHRRVPATEVAAPDLPQLVGRRAVLLDVRRVDDERHEPIRLTAGRAQRGDELPGAESNCSTSEAPSPVWPPRWTTPPAIDGVREAHRLGELRRIDDQRARRHTGLRPSVQAAEELAEVVASPSGAPGRSASISTASASAMSSSRVRSTFVVECASAGPSARRRRARPPPPAAPRRRRRASQGRSQRRARVDLIAEQEQLGRAGESRRGREQVRAPMSAPAKPTRVKRNANFAERATSRRSAASASTAPRPRRDPVYGRDDRERRLPQRLDDAPLMRVNSRSSPAPIPGARR